MAGSYLGSKVGRSHSGSIASAAVGGALFGPVGLVAGASCGDSSGRVESEEAAHKKKTIVAPKDESSDENVMKRAYSAASEHLSSKKYEYGGSTGVIMGATAGAVVLGPVGLIAGAFAGSMSGRKLVESASQSQSALKSHPPPSNCEPIREQANNEETNQPYKFGNITRGVIAKGKKSRGVNKEEEYKFGDFTRGLFGRK